MHSNLVFFFLLGFSSAFQKRFYDDEVDRGDEFVDQLLHDMMHEHGDEYDPYQIEDSQVSFSKKITFVNVTGEAKLHKGYIKGLKTLHRPNHCSMHEDDDKLYVDADLGAGVLDFHYDGTVKFMSWGPTISVFGKLSYLETHMEFSVDAKSGKDGKLEKFYIDDMKGMEVWITGLGPLNWAVNYLISGVTTLFKGYIKNMLEKQVRNHLAERLPNYRFPVDDTTETITSHEISTMPELNVIEKF